jgi:hypothetical protein
MDHKDFDFIIRYENLQEDFVQALKLLDIDAVKPLPVKNRTGLRERDFLSYFSPDTVRQARRVFGPYAKE